MPRHLGLAVGLLLIAVTSMGATCSSETRPEAGADAGGAAAGVLDAGPDVDPSTLPMPTADDLPGFPLDQVVSPLAKQLFALSKDAFSYDGCPTPVQGCLRNPRYRRHALRLLTLATRLASEGQSNREINTLLNTYYASFAPAQRFKMGESIAPCRGPAAAPVVLAEFSDFECPHCAAARPLLDEVLAHSNQVKLCYKPFPLAVHAHARDAAEAALFARDQGKFWEMHDLLFDHQESLGLSDMKGYAAELGLDPKALELSVLSNAHATEIDGSHTLGDRAHLTGTPSIFINGRPLVLNLSRESLAQAIDDELDYQAGHGAFAPDAP